MYPLLSYCTWDSKSSLYFRALDIALIANRRPGEAHGISFSIEILSKVHYLLTPTTKVTDATVPTITSAIALLLPSGCCAVSALSPSVCVVFTEFPALSKQKIKINK